MYTDLGGSKNHLCHIIKLANYLQALKYFIIKHSEAPYYQSRHRYQKTVEHPWKYN
jgi:hypothetical protein